jgi:hypothetical protein
MKKIKLNARCPFCPCETFDYQPLQIEETVDVNGIPTIKTKYVLLIKCSDQGHVLGAVNDPYSEFRA